MSRGRVENKQKIIRVTSLGTKHSHRERLDVQSTVLILSSEIILNCKQLSIISGATPIGSADAHPIVKTKRYHVQSNRSLTQLLSWTYNANQITIYPRCILDPWKLHAWCIGKTLRSFEWAGARTYCVSSETFRARRHEENPGGRARYPQTVILQVDSVRPPRPESILSSRFRVRVWGLEFDVA